MRKTILAILAALTLASCGVYHPQMVDVPLIAHEGDGHVDFNISTNSFNYSIASLNLTASYGLNSWLAVQGAASTDFASNNFGQIAIGGYHAWSHFVAEAYVGFGGGEAFDRGHYDDCDYCDYDYHPYPPHRSPYRHRDDSRYYPAHEDATAGSYRQAFLQIDGGWISLFGGQLDIGIGVKVGAMHTDFTEYGDIRSGDIITNGASYYAIHPKKTIYDDTYAFCERQLMVRIGGQHLKLVGRIGFTSIGADFDYSPISISTGINYRF